MAILELGRRNTRSLVVLGTAALAAGMTFAAGRAGHCDSICTAKRLMLALYPLGASMPW